MDDAVTVLQGQLRICLSVWQWWLQVLSLHSTSKGFLGECGHRGGYLEVLNCPEAIFVQLKKLMSINLCCNTIGQVHSLTE